jgi:hypothetical protein
MVKIINQQWQIVVIFQDNFGTLVIPKSRQFKRVFEKFE